jgi:hypothetical protein
MYSNGTVRRITRSKQLAAEDFSSNIERLAAELVLQDLTHFPLRSTEFYLTPTEDGAQMVA